jgi:uncharacterized delta-60 repeat protein
MSICIISCKKTEVPPKNATVALGEITFTSTTAKIEVNITDDGNTSIMEAGIYYKSTPGANSGGNRINSAPSKGKNTVELTGLKKATTYYVVAFATNSVGTTFTQEMSFNTSPELPTINNQNLSLYDPITANYSYNISDNGGSAVTARGICWNNTGSPTITDNKKIDTLLPGTVSGRLLDLKPNTKYYFRMFATNSVGTSYSSELSYTTDKLNSCFPNPLLFNGSVTLIRVQNDGKLLLAGSFLSINGKDINNIVRLNKDGTIDNSFKYGIDMTLFNMGIYDIMLQGDKLIVVVKSTVTSNQNTIYRLNTDGSVDNTFLTGIPGGNSLNMDVLSNGKIIIVGGITSYNGIANKGIVCLNADGTIDNNFNNGTGFDIKPYQTLALPTGKMLVAGSFTTFNGVSVPNLVRLNSDGSLDRTFTSNISNNTINKLFYDKLTNKIYVNYYNTATFGNFVRLNLDGSVDNTFAAGSLSPNSGNSKAIASVAFQQDGKIIVQGSYSAYNGISFNNNLLRLNSNGTIDNTFVTGKGFGNSNTPASLYTGALAISILDDKSILIAGGFVTFDGAPVKYFLKLNENFTTCGY